MEESKIKQLIESGIPLVKTRFHQAVNNAEGMPESQFNDDSSNPSRKVKMWLTQCGVLCLHKDAYFIVPTSNVIETKLKL